MYIDSIFKVLVANHNIFNFFLVKKGLIQVLVYFNEIHKSIATNQTLIQNFSFLFCSSKT